MQQKLPRFDVSDTMALRCVGKRVYAMAKFEDRLPLNIRQIILCDLNLLGGVVSASPRSQQPLSMRTTTSSSEADMLSADRSETSGGFPRGHHIRAVGTYDPFTAMNS